MSDATPLSTPAAPEITAAERDELRRHGILLTSLEELYNWGRSNSVWPLQFGLACCAIEMIAASMARFDIARFGSEVFRPSPRQADLLIVDGNPAANLKYLYSFGDLTLDRSGQMIRTQGIVHTIKDGVVLNNAKLMEEVERMVREFHQIVRKVEGYRPNTREIRYALELISQHGKDAWSIVQYAIEQGQRTHYAFGSFLGIRRYVAEAIHLLSQRRAG